MYKTKLLFANSLRNHHYYMRDCITVVFADIVSQMISRNFSINRYIIHIMFVI